MLNALVVLQAGTDQLQGGHRDSTSYATLHSGPCAVHAPSAAWKQGLKLDKQLDVEVQVKTSADLRFAVRAMVTSRRTGVEEIYTVMDVATTNGLDWHVLLKRVM